MTKGVDHYQRSMYKGMSLRSSGTLCFNKYMFDMSLLVTAIISKYSCFCTDESLW